MLFQGEIVNLSFNIKLLKALEEMKKNIISPFV